MTRRKNTNGNSVAIWACNIVHRSDNPERYDTAMGHAFIRAAANLNK